MYFRDYRVSLTYVNIYTLEHHLDLGLWTEKMYILEEGNFTVNYTEPKLPENPVSFFKEYNSNLILWMSPILILSVWVNIYVFFNIILFFSKMYKDCVEKRSKTICTGEFKCKKGCENCVGNIFLETYV